MSFEWKTDDPGAHGFNADRLGNLWGDLEAKGTMTFLLVRNDCIVFERYGEGWDASKAHHTASMVKALVGGMSLALAMQEGLISPDDAAADYVPEWRDDPVKSKITLRHLATHTGGVKNATDEADDWAGTFWKREDPPNDPFTVSRDRAPILYTPGTDYNYSNPGIAMLGYAVTRAIQNLEEKDVRTLLTERVMRPIGAPEDSWGIGYGQTFEVDGLELVGNWGGGNYAARTTARVGRLMMRKGNWEGEQLIHEDVAEQMVAHAGMPSSSGLCWWVNATADGTPVWPSVPGDAFIALGAGHQILLVVPSLDLVMVRNGQLLEDSVFDWGTTNRHLFDPLMATLEDSA